jgi:GT2 family glycosyltransferase
MNGINTALVNPPRFPSRRRRFEVPSSERADPIRLPVYVIHWDAPDWCVATVESLLSSNGVDVEVCVVDNGPHDASVTLADALSTRVRIIDAGANTGFTGAANLAVTDWFATPDTPFAVIASHDLRLAPDSLRRLIAALRSDERLGVVGPERGIIGEAHDQGGRECVTELTSWISGSCLAVRRACLAEVGPFDERLGSYVEDVDICYRAWDAGWEVARVQGMVMGWHGSRSDAARTSIDTNWILLALKRSGPLGALRLAASLAVPISRNALGMLAFARPKAAREASRRQAIARARAYPRAAGQVRRWGMSSWRTQPSVPRSWTGPSPAGPQVPEPESNSSVGGSG